MCINKDNSKVVNDEYKILKCSKPTAGRLLEELMAVSEPVVLQYYKWVGLVMKAQAGRRGYLKIGNHNH